MSVPELERELARARGDDVAATGAPRLSIEEALRVRAAGNVPDAAGRSLRLVLHVRNAQDVKDLGRRRLEFEPDFHLAPTWRRKGSVPMNVVPLRLGPIAPAPERGWWDDPEVAPLEAEWRRTGRVAGVGVPAEYRGFVYKTVLSLRAANEPVSLTAIVASLERWLAPRDVSALRAALKEANP